MPFSVFCSGCEQTFILDPKKPIDRIMDNHNSTYHPEKLSYKVNTVDLAEKRREYRKANKERFAKYQRAYRKANKNIGGAG